SRIIGRAGGAESARRHPGIGSRSTGAGGLPQETRDSRSEEQRRAGIKAGITERKTEMRGSIKKRYRGSWDVILHLGYEPDPNDPGRRKRKQKWHSVKGTKQDAENLLADLLKAAKDGTLVDPSKITLGEWLTEWFKAAKPRFRPNTRTRYN